MEENTATLKFTKDELMYLLEAIDCLDGEAHVLSDPKRTSILTKIEDGMIQDFCYNLNLDHRKDHIDYLDFTLFGLSPKAAENHRVSAEIEYMMHQHGSVSAYEVMRDIKKRLGNYLNNHLLYSFATNVSDEVSDIQDQLYDHYTRVFYGYQQMLDIFDPAFHVKRNLNMSIPNQLELSITLAKIGVSEDELRMIGCPKYLYDMLMDHPLLQESE